MTRTVVAAVALMVALGTVSEAAAAEFDVLACGTGGGINRSWSGFLTDSASLRIDDSCAALTGGPEDGLYAVDRLPGPPNALGGREAGWRVTAPAGTRITRLTLQFYLGQNSSGEWLPFIRTAEGALLEGCVPTGGQTTCERGTSAYSPLGPSSTFQLDTSAVEAGIRCAVSTGSCVNGASLHAAWLALYSSRVQITDPSSPTLSTPSGALWADGYHRGIETLVAQASDNTGIRATRLRVDGFERAAAVRTCDFTLTVPCSNEPGAMIALDTRGIADGPHQLTALAEDAGLNVTSMARTIVVDNSPPAAPADVTLDGASGPRSTNSFTVRWRNPAGQVAPIAAARWSLCPATGSECMTASASGVDIAQVGALQVPGPGDWDLRVWLEDAAGNASSDRAAGPLRLSLAGTSGRNPGVRIRGVSRRGDS